MRTLSLLLVSAVSMLLGCSDASPTANGGQPLLGGGDSGGSVLPSGDGGAPTWSALYSALFAPGAPAQCSGSGCHTMGQLGGGYWVCGAGASACRQGLIDAMFVPQGGGDFTKTVLYSALHRPNCSPMGLQCNMPLGGLTFTQPQIDQIGAWVQAGAPDN